MHKASLKKNIKGSVTMGMLSFCMLITLVACGVNDAGGREEGFLFVDDAGREVVIESTQRVVCAYGSYAEVWTLAGGEVLATTDDAIRERDIGLRDVINIGIVTEPDIEMMIALEPDFIILSADVTAHVKAVETFERAGIPCALFHIEHFEDYLRTLEIFTQMTGREDLYALNGLAVQEEIDGILARERPKEAPTVLFLRGHSSGASVKGEDSMVGRMLQDLGVLNIADAHPSLLEQLNVEEIILSNPDFIFMTLLGDNSEVAIASLNEVLWSNEAFESLDALNTEGHYIILDKSLFHYKPNARWAEAYEFLYETLYSEE